MSEQEARQRRAFFTRQPPKVDIHGFLAGLVDNSPEVQQMREALAQADHDNVAKEARIRVLEQENHRISRMRDEWMNVANLLQIEVKTMANTAATAAEQAASASISVANQCKKSVEAAELNLARSGMAMESPSVHSAMTDEETAKIARMLQRKPHGAHDKNETL